MGSEEASVRISSWNVILEPAIPCLLPMREVLTISILFQILQLCMIWCISPIFIYEC